MIGSIFHTAKDAFGSAEGDKPSDWIVFRVTEVDRPEARRQLGTKPSASPRW